MNLEQYELFAGSAVNSFEFISSGKKGNITKLVQFQDTGIPDLYNLAFGDKVLETKELDDRTVSDNGDAEKVLATVVSAIYIFTTKHSHIRIYIEGSTRPRNRLYQMGLNKYFDLAVTDFEIIGRREDNWEWYQKGNEYNAFIIFRKR